jgi:hypothetical protein
MKTLTNIIALSALFGLAATGCGSTDDPDTIDQAKLAQFRAAIPQAGQLEAAAPEASASAALGDPALFPTASWDIVQGINGSVTGIVTVMRTIVDQPPTLFNSATQEFFWGPYPNDDGYGYVAAYIRDAGAGEDFRYHYALLRGASNDVATLSPVIWGGANPDASNPDRGSGITLWDFEANYAWEQANNPDAASLVLDRGRFVTLYGAGPDQTNPANEVGIILASFRNFVSKDDPTAEPANLDYFYGRFVTPNLTIDFLDYELALDVSDPADGIAENVGVRMAFLNAGAGRAEADAVGGSLTAEQSVSAIECWDVTLSESYLRFDFTDGAGTVTAEDGTLANCNLFQASLDEMGVPSLDDVDPALRAALEYIAQNGVPAE